MNDMSGISGAQGASESAFTFTGAWREFLPIALTNLALSIVTLGIYRFWAKARERRYLWSRTRFIDDSFEWTGTGLEMFLGFLIVMVILIPCFLVLNFGLQALALRGEFVAAGIIAAIIYAAFLFLYHVAMFRALRYRLSRSWWHGIRGGSDARGWRYGLSGFWKTLVAVFTIGLMTPWAMTRLWNERLRAMSFGPHPFEADVNASRLIGRWLAIYAAPVVGGILMMVFAMLGAVMSQSGQPGEISGPSFALLVVGVLLFYLTFLIVSLGYYALFYRKVAAATSVAGIRFNFTARTKDWLVLIAGHIGLVIVTLGVGLLFIGYRNWSFVIRHMEATGVVNLDLLTQSTTRAPTDAEGLADAFDFGAI